MNKQQETKFKAYANSGIFSATQLMILRKAFDQGLTLKEVSNIADPSLAWDDMQAKIIEKTLQHT